MRLNAFSGIAAIQSGLVLLVWLQVGRSFGWRDAAFAISCGFVLASLRLTLFPLLNVTEQWVTRDCRSRRILSRGSCSIGVSSSW
jgi:hypothetical protein